MKNNAVRFKIQVKIIIDKSIQRNSRKGKHVISPSCPQHCDILTKKLFYKNYRIVKWYKVKTTGKLTFERAEQLLAKSPVSIYVTSKPTVKESFLLTQLTAAFNADSYEY